MLAPPWIPAPAHVYGGTDEVVRLLCEGLAGLEHEVTLLAPPGSDAPVSVEEVLDAAHADEIERSLHEVDHVARSFAYVDEQERQGRPFDVVHDHCGFAALAMADRLATPLVHTVHRPFGGATYAFYSAHGHKGTVVGISRSQLAKAPPNVAGGPVVHDPLAVDEWPFSDDHGGPLVWMGRVSPVKGPHRAIAVARATGRALILAGPVQPGQEDFFATEVEPHIDDDLVTYEGEADAERKRELYLEASAVLMPIRWDEPFGLVMAEAMACGTPVISFREGAAAEVVEHGVTGFLVDDEQGMTACVGRLHEIDPHACREHVRLRFDPTRIAPEYARVYAQAAKRRGTRLASA